MVWAGKGRSAETLDAFFDLLGPSGCEGIALVAADLAASWQKALRARVPHARVVFDRFHVERLASDAAASRWSRSASRAPTRAPRCFDEEARPQIEGLPQDRPLVTLHECQTGIDRGACHGGRVGLYRGADPRWRHPATHVLRPRTVFQAR